MPDNLSTQLAIDTGTDTLSLALHAGGEILCRRETAGNRHAELILPAIARLLAEAGIGVAALDGIVYAQGPGAFTGLRIGIGTAQGLAAPFDTPLTGVPSLDAAAYLLPPQACVLAAADARMGEVFYAWFDTEKHIRLSPYRVGRADGIRLPENVRAAPAAIGNAFALPEPPPFSGSPRMPEAADYLRLAQSGRYPATDAAAASLLYVRDKVALTAAEQHAARAAKT